MQAYLSFLSMWPFWSSSIGAHQYRLERALWMFLSCIKHCQQHFIQWWRRVCFKDHKVPPFPKGDWRCPPWIQSSPCNDSHSMLFVEWYLHLSLEYWQALHTRIGVSKFWCHEDIGRGPSLHSYQVPSSLLLLAKELGQQQNRRREN